MDAVSQDPVRQESVRSAYRRVGELREELARAAVDQQRVWSMDGAIVQFDLVTDSPVGVGGYVELELADGTRLVAHVTALEPSERPGPSLSFDVTGLGMDATATVQVPIRSVEGSGIILGVLDDEGVSSPPREAFDAARLRPAPREAVAALVSMQERGDRLSFGRLLEDDTEIALLAKGFGKHTFVCGQSGSGKTYSIGKLLEQLLLRTDLQIVVIDPNSDYVTITRPRGRDQTGLDPEAYRQQCAQLEELAPRVPVFSQEDRSLAVLFGRLRLSEQAIVLGLDPLADLIEHGALVRAVEEAGADATLDHFLEVAARTEGGAVLVERARNLGVDRWEVWAREGQATVADRLASGWRAAVFDLGTVASPRERAVVAAGVLGALWSRRYERQPRLVLIDEAHNVCPATPTSEAQAAAAGIVRAIAAEGRKYGLYLLLSTQEPHKVHPDVLSQCSNLVLMRTTSEAALHVLSSVFSDLPPDLLRLARTFTLGQGVVTGRIVPHPLTFRTSERLTRDGGRDVPATWATGGGR